jgi:hypothetical protein
MIEIRYKSVFKALRSCGVAAKTALATDNKKTPGK